MKNRNNDNENVKLISKNNYINNDNVADSKYARARKVEETADLLISKLRLDNGSRPFMCKVAWKLSEHKIWSNFEAATSNPKTKNPVGLFIYLCKRDGV